jgi:2-amino-4-hydroxy-6-hydroxymethyldihydropteridine diphosphokinase
MPRAWISIGSNIDREHHIRAALAELQAMFGELAVSPVYETEAVGFEGDAFYNLVVGIDTARRPAELHRLMREIEARNGRERSGARFSSRTLDLDLLTYGDESTDEGGKVLPRDEILKYAFVLAPLADVAGDERHPDSGQTYRALWQAYARPDRDSLKRLPPFAWQAAGAGN